MTIELEDSLSERCYESVVRTARREAARCERAVAQGSPVEFWRKRMCQYAAELEKAAATLRETIAALPRESHHVR